MENSDVVVRRGDHGVVFPKDGQLDVQRLGLVFQGFFIVALGVIHQEEAVVTLRDIGVVLAEHGEADVQRLVVVCQRLVRLALTLINQAHIRINGSHHRMVFAMNG